MRKAVIALGLSLLLISLNSFAASTDFDGNGISDPSAVQLDGVPLDWYALVAGQNTKITNDFGALGNHLMPGRYAGGLTMAGYVEQDGMWHVMNGANKVKFKLGSANSTFIGGADLNGGGDDAVVVNGACQKKATTINTIFDPIVNQKNTAEIKGGDGRFYHTFGDADGDGLDEICWLEPVRKDRLLTGRFRLRCNDPVTGKKVARFGVGKVFSAPEPVFVGAGQPNYFAFFSRVGKGAAENTRVKVLNVKGKSVAKFDFTGTGTTLIGNYTNISGQPEQIGLASNALVSIFDLTTQVISSAGIPSGIPFDEVNINRFQDQDCFCNSASIKKGKCTTRTGGGGNGGGGSGGGSNGGGNGGGGNSGGNGGSCSETPDGGALWKPKSDFHPGPRYVHAPGTVSQTCNYERNDGTVFMPFHFSGFANPVGGVDRQHWTPDTEIGCGAYPAGRMRCNNNCWAIPNPCQRLE